MEMVTITVLEGDRRKGMGLRMRTMVVVVAQSFSFRISSSSYFEIRAARCEMRDARNASIVAPVLLSYSPESLLSSSFYDCERSSCLEK